MKKSSLKTVCWGFRLPERSNCSIHTLLLRQGFHLFPMNSDVLNLVWFQIVLFAKCHCLFTRFNSSNKLIK